MRVRSAVSTMCAVAAGSVAALATAADAATLRVPSKFASVQEAVDAAAPGDVILVSKGLFRENVVVPAGRDGLVIRGRGTVLDGTTAAEWGVVITVLSPGVVVEGVRFRNGESAVRVQADGVTVRKCTQQATRARFVEAYGAARTRVEGNRVRGYQLFGGSGDDVVVRGNRMLHSDDTAVNVSGDDVVIEQNLIRSTWETAINVQGSRATLRKNTIDVTSGYGINCWNRSADADGGVIEGNVLRNIFGDGIRLDGRGFRVERNVIDGCSALPVRIMGDGATVLRNAISRARDGGILITSRALGSATGVTVEDNVATQCMGEPYHLAVSGAAIRRNRSLESGERYHVAFTLLGDDNQIEANSATDAGGHGFVVTGARNALTRCTVTGGASSGFWIAGGTANRLDGCVAKDCAEYGIVNLGEATELRSCTFLESGLADLTNDAGAPYPVFDRVRFFTGSQDEPALWSSGNPR